ncbi:MAG: hypothetical protein GY737_31420 [Desulfobacteraceae bacterium]|nr:hypothetical protein [Desulfobacteraceae bacterium]
MDELRQSLEILPDLGIAHLYLSKCLLSQNAPHDARKSYNKAISLNPELKDLFHWFNIEETLWTLYIKNNKFDEAGTVCEKAVSILEREEIGNPLLFYYTCRALMAKGDLHNRKGETDRSISAYKKALMKVKGKIEGKTDKSNCKKIHQALVALYREKGENEKARHHENEALALEADEKFFRTFRQK